MLDAIHKDDDSSKLKELLTPSQETRQKTKEIKRKPESRGSTLTQLEKFRSYLEDCTKGEPGFDTMKAAFEKAYQKATDEGLKIPDACHSMREKLANL